MRPPLLWHSNSPLAPTGYGTQTATFVPLLKEAGWDVSISAFYGLEGAPIIWQDIKVFPGLGGTFGNEALVPHAKGLSENGEPRDVLILTLMDVWVLGEVMKELNCCSWVPVDHKPVPPAVIKFFLESGSVPLAMSRFGEEELSKVGLDPIYVPHGIDTETYKPYPQKEAREILKMDQRLPDGAFLVGMVAANQGRSPSRKGFQQAFEAFKIFREKHENAYLYLHTSFMHQWTQGEDLGNMLALLDVPNDSVVLADYDMLHFNPPTPRRMALLYSSLDVLLNPAMGEGFGLPQLEAQSCGVPVIASDNTASREVVQVGWKVPGLKWYTGQKSWQYIADIPAIVDALEECYALTPAQKEGMGRKARQHALKYSAPKVLKDHFLPALDEVEERLFKPKAPSVPAKVVS